MGALVFFGRGLGHVPFFPSLSVVSPDLYVKLVTAAQIDWQGLPVCFKWVWFTALMLFFDALSRLPRGAFPEISWLPSSSPWKFLLEPWFLFLGPPHPCRSYFFVIF